MAAITGVLKTSGRSSMILYDVVLACVGLAPIMHQCVAANARLTSAPSTSRPAAMQD